MHVPAALTVEETFHLAGQTFDATAFLGFLRADVENR
jgi:hypothetical protein